MFEAPSEPGNAGLFGGLLTLYELDMPVSIAASSVGESGLPDDETAVDSRLLRAEPTLEED